MVRESIATACCNDIQVILSAFPDFAGLYKGSRNHNRGSLSDIP